MYSLILLAAMAAGPHDQAMKVADEAKANGRAFAFRGRGVNVRVGGFSAFRGGFGFRHGVAFRHVGAFRFNAFRYGYAPFLGFRSYGYAAPFVSSYAYAAPFAAYSGCAPAAYYAPPQAFSGGCGCDGGTSAAVQELRAAVAELRQALQYR